MEVNGSAICSANSIKILLLTPSGPAALPSGSDLRIDKISSDVRTRESSADVRE